MMKPTHLALAIGAALCGLLPAHAQYSAATPRPTKAGVTSAGSGGGFLVGTDECGAPHRALPPGEQLGVAFTTGTTGSEGQNEANCYSFGTSGIDNDAWWDWTATAGGEGRLTTCGGTSVDTKIAVWPGTPGACPADGSSLACNDDACGLQSTVLWNVNPGASYTFQLGTFPGAAGGSGTFDLTVADPPVCGQYDGGTSGNALGLTSGGESGWLHGQTCFERIDQVETAYGTPGAAAPVNGAPSVICVYEDVDCDLDPTTGPPTLLWSFAGSVTNAGTDLFTTYPTGGIDVPSRCSWVMATAVQAAGVFPAPMDVTNPTPVAWIVGQTPTGARMDVQDLNGNNVPPLQLQAIGFPAAWLLRAGGVESSTGPCDSGGFPDACILAACRSCPCGNDGDGFGGCDNSLGQGGTTLGASGSAQLGNDGLVLTATRTPDQPGIFFQGNDGLGNPPAFGDGFRCCGNGVVRIGTYQPSGNVTDTATGNQVGGIGPPISLLPGNSTLTPGDSRCYQFWYRDPQGPCGETFNTSNRVEVVWQ